MSRQLLILAAAALWPFSAQAADTPKEGSDKLMVRFVRAIADHVASYPAAAK